MLIQIENLPDNYEGDPLMIAVKSARIVTPERLCDGIIKAFRERLGGGNIDFIKGIFPIPADIAAAMEKLGGEK